MQCPSFNEGSLAEDGDGSKREGGMMQRDGDEAAIVHHDYVISSYVPVHAHIHSHRCTEHAEDGFQTTRCSFYKFAASYAAARL